MTILRLALARLLVAMLATSAGLTSASAAGTGALRMGTSEKGHVILLGHDIPPPYTLTVRYRLSEGDTVFEQIRLNGMPLLPEPNPRPPMPEKYARIGAAGRAAVAGKQVTGTERLELIAGAYESLTDLVDSANVISSDGIQMYWKDGTSETFLFAAHSTASPAQLSRNLLELAASHLGSLKGGSALVFGRGVIVVPARWRAELAREVAEIRSGVAGSRRILKQPEEQAIIRDPPALPPVQE